MNLNLSGNLGGQIDEMLQGSVAGNISLIEPQPDPPILDTLNVTENGTYTPPSGTDGYNEVIVDVPTPEPVLDTLSVTENGTYTPPSGTDGYNEVNVNIPLNNQVMTQSFNIFKESSSNQSFYPDYFNLSWDGGGSILNQIAGLYNISNYSKLKVSLTTGTSYYNNVGQHPDRRLFIGTSSSKITSSTAPSSVQWNDVEIIDQNNTSYNFELDLNNTNEYLYISANGWNVSNLKIELV